MLGMWNVGITVSVLIETAVSFVSSIVDFYLIIVLTKFIRKVIEVSEIVSESST